MLCAWCGVGDACVGMSIIVGQGLGGSVGASWRGLEIVGARGRGFW